MSWAGLSGGAAIPAGWTAAAAAAVSREDGNASVQRSVRDLDLLVGVSPKDFPVRNQGHRGACNAFAVIAAEELLRHRAGKMKGAFSEESLHYAIHEQGKKPLKIPRPQKKEPILIERGESYLEEALMALAQFGFRSTGVAFDIDPLLPVNHVKAGSVLGPEKPTAPLRGYVHNIKRDALGNLNWVQPLPEDQTVASLFYAALEEGKPVVAALPIFTVPGMNIFTSVEAQRFGRASYPPKDLAVTLDPVDGHAVCLVGYQRRSTDRLDGWFVFRNSFGTEAFARDRETDCRTPRAPAPGYGLIPVVDVERWCWEYLIAGPAA